jgi:hypothetical protein
VSFISGFRSQVSGFKNQCHSFQVSGLRFPVSKINKLVIAGVAEVVVEPDPFLFIEEGFAGESPTLEVEEFLFVAVALEHDVALLADPLDFGESSLEFENPEVVKRGE